RRMTRVVACFTLMCLAVLMVAAEQPAEKVTVAQLLSTPEKFIGKRVDVIGYYRLQDEDSSLLADERAAAQPWTPDNCIGIDFEIWDPRFHHKRPPNIATTDDVGGRMIRVRGTFRYHKIIAADLRTGRKAVLAYGHMGVWPRALEDITYLQPLR